MPKNRVTDEQVAFALRQVEAGASAGPSTVMAVKMKALERENRELRRANEFLRKGLAHPAMPECSAASLRAMPESLDRRSKW